MATGADGGLSKLAGEGTCSIKDCGRAVHAKGLCITHYNRRRKGEQMLAPIKPYLHVRLCSITGCDEPTIALGLCSAHYQRHRRAEARDRRRRRIEQ
jgi:hypothetical protein